MITKMVKMMQIKNAKFVLSDNVVKLLKKIYPSLLIKRDSKLLVKIAAYA